MNPAYVKHNLRRVTRALREKQQHLPALLEFKAKEAASEEETSLTLDFSTFGKIFDGMLLSRQELQSREEPGWTVQE
jgi:hypothetical protein